MEWRKLSMALINERKAASALLACGGNIASSWRRKYAGIGWFERRKCRSVASRNSAESGDVMAAGGNILSAILALKYVASAQRLKA
jgi:hypothetical protein